jgi:hypothetical protein
MSTTKQEDYLKSLTGNVDVYRENRKVFLVWFRSVLIEDGYVHMKFVTINNKVHRGGIELKPLTRIDNLYAGPDRWVIPYIVINIYFDPQIITVMKKHFLQENTFESIHAKLYALL